MALNTKTLTPHSSFVLKSFETNNSFKYGCRSYFNFNLMILIYFLVMFEVVYLYIEVFKPSTYTNIWYITFILSCQIIIAVI
jgi:hypothetical protein